MTRVCACGCGASLAGMRADALWSTDACRKRGYAPPSAEKGRNRHGPRGGLQVSYRRAEAILRAALRYRAGYADDRADYWADCLMREALPERQRERLEARG